MKLKYKILLGFAALTAILLIIEGYTLVFLNRTNTRISEIVEQKFTTEKIVQESNVIIMQIHSDIWDAMLFGEELREMQAGELGVKATIFYANLRKLREKLPEEEDALTTLANLFRVYFQFGTGILEFKDLDEFNRRSDVVVKFKENKGQLIALLDDTVSESSLEFEKSLMTLKQNFHTTTLLTAALTGIIVLLAVVLSLLISNALTRPVDALMAAMQQFKTGDLTARAEVHTRDELGTLADTFNAMGEELQESLNRRQEQERLQQEMALARQIQTAILPGKIEHEELNIEAMMLPADEVGGDYYDMVRGPNGNLWLGIGDVSGHGVTPGLIMMMAQTIHTTLTLHKSYTPKDVMNEVNRVLYHNVNTRLKANHFMTFTTLKYLGGGEFVHAGAHLSLIVYRQVTGTCERIETYGTWLNFVPDISHATKDQTFHLEVGDVLVLYTDGLTEAQNADGELLDIERFTELVQTHAEKTETEGLAAMRDHILDDVLAWCNYTRADDMTLVVVKRDR